MTPCVGLQVKFKSRTIFGKFMDHANILTIGELADRTGLTTSAIRFYETKGSSPQTAMLAVSAASCEPTSAVSRLR